MSTVSLPSVDTIRAQFPSLAEGFAFMDNAGGSQVPKVVADAITDYLLRSNAQIGADYPASQRATKTVDDAHEWMNVFMGGGNAGRAILGASSSALCRMIAECYGDALKPGDEVIVAESGHEANVFPWINLARRGMVVKIWEANPETGVCDVAALATLLSPNTKVVAFPHVSNILGQVEDIGPCIAMAKQAGARVVVDGVAYAPHLAMEADKWGVDWYVFSCYKVFGPHVAAMWGRHEAFAELTGPNHPFIAKDYLPTKFELGGANPESCAGLLALRPYLCLVADRPEADAQTVSEAFQIFEGLERPLTEQFLQFLARKPKVRIVGPDMTRARLATISFTHETVSSKEIADAAMSQNVGMRWGNFYSVRLLQRLGIDPETGVARASFAHYNTTAEVDRLITALDPLL